MNIEKFKENLKSEVSRKRSEGYQSVPIVSGGTALYFFQEIIFSNLDNTKYYVALFCATLLFIASCILYFLLRKLEKEKDRCLLNTVGKIVEDVFKHYGVAMASNSAGPTTANEMNPIMQTIVNLIKELKELIDKNYLRE
jgi:sensor histidine kinase YesM